MEIIKKYFPDLTDNQIEQFAALGDLYRYWNERINVISRKDIDELYLRHILHSLAIVKTEKISQGDTILDVGSGGGFPGIPLAIMMPENKFTLCDSIGKKINVIKEVSRSIGLNNVTAVHSRVEELPDSYDWIVSRAVTRLNRFIDWTWEKTANGILYLKGGDLAEEISECSQQITTYKISDWFEEDFFDTKVVLHVRK